MIVVGLGNPGDKYAKTYHNIGFITIDKLSEKLGVKLSEKGSKALYSTSYIDGEKTVVAKPQTFMNLSGEAVKMLMNSNGFTAKDVLIIFDDIELPLGSVRIRREGSGGSHNGMKNIVQECGTTAIARVRIGLGDDRGRADLANYVLSNIPKEKMDVLDVVLDKVTDGILQYLKDKDLDKFMQKCNGMIK